MSKKPYFCNCLCHLRFIGKDRKPGRYCRKHQRIPRRPTARLLEYAHKRPFQRDVRKACKSDLHQRMTNRGSNSAIRKNPLDRLEVLRHRPKSRPLKPVNRQLFRNDPQRRTTGIPHPKAMPSLQWMVNPVCIPVVATPQLASPSPAKQTMSPLHIHIPSTSSTVVQVTPSPSLHEASNRIMGMLDQSRDYFCLGQILPPAYGNITSVLAFTSIYDFKR